MQSPMTKTCIRENSLITDLYYANQINNHNLQTRSIINQLFLIKKCNTTYENRYLGLSQKIRVTGCHYTLHPSEHQQHLPLVKHSQAMKNHPTINAKLCTM